MQHESMDYDLLIVGGGPAGLTAALRARQAACAAGIELSVAVVEKGAEIGAHTLSGAILDPRALDELLPDWRTQAPPCEGPVTEEALCLLGARHALRLPYALLPPSIRHRGQLLVSLGRLTAWLAERAEAAGVDIFTGFAAASPLYAGTTQTAPLTGVVTGDFGIARDGSRKPNFQPGVALNARYTLLAEGCRGHLTRLVEERFDLRNGVCPQKYGLGFRELWRIPADRHVPGRALHTLGWPLAGRAQGGGFVYHLQDRLAAIGLIVHLDYENPSLSPFDEFQRFKTHPLLRSLLAGGERLNYGARTLAEGGVQSLPRLAFPGGALIGGGAGLVNLPRTQGIHTAMKSAMLAADAAVAALVANRRHDTLDDYDRALRASWVYDELWTVRNVKPCLHLGFWRGLGCAGALLWTRQLARRLGFHRRLPWTLRHRFPDHRMLRPAVEMPILDYPPYDGVVTFDRASSVYLSRTRHEEDQPCHLRLVDAERPEQLNLPRYGGPEIHYCPAGVYEYRRAGEALDAPLTLRIHAANCLHCKACDIKDPTQNIRWVPPEAGDGPHYGNM